MRRHQSTEEPKNLYFYFIRRRYVIPRYQTWTEHRQEIARLDRIWTEYQAYQWTEKHPASLGGITYRTDDRTLIDPDFISWTTWDRYRDHNQDVPDAIRAAYTAAYRQAH